MIKAVCFDLDGTLYDSDAFVTDFLSDQYPEVPNRAGRGREKSRFVGRILEWDAHGHGNKAGCLSEASEPNGDLVKK